MTTELFIKKKRDGYALFGIMENIEVYVCTDGERNEEKYVDKDTCLDAGRGGKWSSFHHIKEKCPKCNKGLIIKYNLDGEGEMLQMGTPHKYCPWCLKDLGETVDDRPREDWGGTLTIKLKEE